MGYRKMAKMPLYLYYHHGVNKNLDSAIATFKMVINQLPNNKDTWNHIGICYKEKGQIEESKFYFDRARDIRTGNKDTPIVPKRDY
jgi:tetratricopeptide (TPR) repeat protein